MSLKNVCVVTGSRAEYGLLYPILKKIQSSDSLNLQLVVSTMHLANEFGLTYKQIEKDGFNIDDKIENLLSPDTKSSVAKSSGLATLLLSDSFNRLEPDVVLVLGDRYETHAAAVTAMLMTIPIVHIHGGEITEGAVDEQIRHSITKMSYLHFTSTEVYRQRVIQMGEDPNRVFNSGAPGLDNIMNLELLSKDELETILDWEFGEKSALFTYHPATLQESDVKNDMDEIFEALLSTDMNVLFTYANADENGRVINEKIEEFCQADPKRFSVEKNLGQLKYLSAMKYVDILIGNTSSGIIEAASFNKPVVNIGSRQKGRLQSGNVVDCDVDTLKNAVSQAISEAFQSKCQEIDNVYGNGKAAQYIVDIIEKTQFSTTKKFVDIHEASDNV